MLLQLLAALAGSVILYWPLGNSCIAGEGGVTAQTASNPAVALFPKIAAGPDEQEAAMRLCMKTFPVGISAAAKSQNAHNLICDLRLQNMAYNHGGKDPCAGLPLNSAKISVI